MCCNATCAKFFLILLNSIVFLAGVAFLAVGIIILVEDNVLLSVLSRIPVGNTTQDALEIAADTVSLFESASYLIIAVGAVILFISFCGCVGAIKNSKCLLTLYAVIITIILCAQIAGAVLAFLYKERVDQTLQKFLEKTLNEYDGLDPNNGSLSKSENKFSEAWDIAMIKLECCGNNNSSDFADWNKNYSFAGFSGMPKVPLACCKTNDQTSLLKYPDDFQKYLTNATHCLSNGMDSKHTNTEGCYAKIKARLQQYLYIIIGIALGIAGTELIVLISACCIIRSIGRDN